MNIIVESETCLSETEKIFGGLQMQLTESVKHLSVFINKKLTFKKYIDHVWSFAVFKKTIH